MKPPTLTTIRPGVTFTPGAAASFRRLERALGRRVDVNSTYRDWGLQLRMYDDWRAYVEGRGPKPNHSRAVQPKYSVHCQGKALDSDDWRTPGFIALAAEHGWIRTAASDPTERHHFEYQWWHDQHRDDPEPATITITPDPEPEEEEDDMYRPTVHARLAKDGKTQDEWTLGHPDIGQDLPVFDGTVTTKNSRLAPDKSVKVFRGFAVTVNRDIFTAWARTHGKGTGDITSSTDRDGYVTIQKELSRIAGEVTATPHA
jgi:hypothetical protein